MSNRSNRFFHKQEPRCVSPRPPQGLLCVVFSPAPKPSGPFRGCFWSECWAVRLSSSEPQASRTRSAWRWSSQTGPHPPRPRPGRGRTWRRARRRAARRSGPCRRSPSGTGRSGPRGWSPRPSLKEWGWCWLPTTGWGTDCGGQRRRGASVTTLSLWMCADFVSCFLPSFLPMSICYFLYILFAILLFHYV